jgi:lipopolysaccharide export system protein LptA
MNRKNESTTIAGENLDAAFLAGASVLDRMRVWGDAQMSSSRGNEAEKDELHAQEIRLSFQDIQGRTALRRLEAERSVNWKTPPRSEEPGGPPRAGRTLSANRLNIRYAAGEDYPDSGDAAGNVVLASIPVREGQRAEIRRLEADTVRFRFWKASGRLREFEGEGHVAVSYHKPADPASEIPAQEFHTTSTNMRATLRENDGEAETVSQWGNFTYQDGARTASAGRGDYQAEKEVMVLQESPKISDANGSTTGVRMEYDQGKQVLAVRQRVRSVLRRATEGGGASSGTAEKASVPTIVTADNLQFWNNESRARYSGSALLLSEDGQLRCNVLEIFGGGERVEGEGDTRHIIFKKGNVSQRGPQEESKPGAKPEKQPERAKSQILIQSSRLRYFKEQNSIHYSEKVILNGEDLWMSSDSLDVVLDPEGRRVEQEFGDYYVSPGKVVVTGNPAQITDPKKGKTQARRLTFFTSDDRVLFETQ